MAGVSTLGQLTAQLKRFDVLGGQFSDLQRALSSNKKTTTYDGLGSDSLSTLRYRTSLKNGDQYVKNIDIATTRIKSMTGSIDLLQNQITRLKTSLVQQSVDGDKADDMTKIQAYTSKLLEIMPGNLNENVDGRYVFAGADSSTKPYQGNDVLSQLVHDDLAAWKTGTITTDTLMTRINGYTDSEVGFSAEVINAGKVTVNADDDLQLDYTVKASDSSVKSLLVATEVLNQLTVPGTTDAPSLDNFHDVLRAMADKVTQGSTGLEAKNVAVQATQVSLQETRDRHGYDATALQNLVSGVEDTDVTETAVKLQNIQLQLEASYRVTATLSTLNLVNFIGS